MRLSICVTAPWPNALKTTYMKYFHMNVHQLRISLVPMERNQFLCMMSTTAANIMLVTVSHSVIKSFYDIF